MLYDILIIDDDFSGETVLGEIELNSKTSSNNSTWEQTIMPFYFELIRDNLKVIWSTGELDDLEKLNESHLSKVQYIICDLHLLGIKETDENKNITSKIMGILEKLNDKLNGKISFLLNSKYIDKHKNIEQELEEGLSKKYPEKYSVTKFSEKNAITEEQKQALLDVSLLSHIKEQIITKHLEVERCLNEKITKNDRVLNELSFFSKKKIVCQTHSLNGCKNKITKLNESRNAIAHTQINSLDELKNIKNIDSDIKKIKCFKGLFKYLKKIDDLIADITKAAKK